MGARFCLQAELHCHSTESGTEVVSAMGHSAGVREKGRGRIQGDGVLSPLLPTNLLAHNQDCCAGVGRTSEGRRALTSLQI